jgi:hypothetical protein
VIDSGISAADARANGWNVPPDVPDCAGLFYDALEPGEVTVGPGNRVNMNLRMVNPRWQWVSGTAVLTAESPP